MYHSPNLERRKDLSPELASMVFDEIRGIREIEAEVISEASYNRTPEVPPPNSERIVYMVAKTKTPYGTAVLCGSFVAVIILAVSLVSFTTGYRLGTLSNTQTLKLTK